MRSESLPGRIGLRRTHRTAFLYWTHVQRPSGSTGILNARPELMQHFPLSGKQAAAQPSLSFRASPDLTVAAGARYGWCKGNSPSEVLNVKRRHAMSQSWQVLRHTIPVKCGPVVSDVGTSKSEIDCAVRHSWTGSRFSRPKELSLFAQRRRRLGTGAVGRAPLPGSPPPCP